MIVQNTSEDGVTDISFTVPHGDLEVSMSIAENLVGEIGASGVSSDTEVARVTVIGAGMRSNPGVAASMFETLAENGINIQMISTSAIRISCMVAENQINEAFKELNENFGLAES